jgi:hypothetical protein
VKLFICSCLGLRSAFLCRLVSCSGLLPLGSRPFLIVRLLSFIGSLLCSVLLALPWQYLKVWNACLCLPRTYWLLKKGILIDEILLKLSSPILVRLCSIRFKHPSKLHETLLHPLVFWEVFSLIFVRKTHQTHQLTFVA